MKFIVNAWDPGYGSALRLEELGATPTDVDPAVEVPAGHWKPVNGPSAPSNPPDVLFIDGVRRIDARVWIEGPSDLVEQGICVSYAAGSMRCGALAHLDHFLVERALLTAAPTAEAILTRAGDFFVRAAASSEFEKLLQALQDRMTDLERQIAEQAGETAGDALVVVDGPLRGSMVQSRAVGYVKTHDVMYLPAEQHLLVARLQAGQRTPVFRIGARWSRYSWYLKLPARDGGPWTGIVRCEVSADRPVAEVVALAELTAAILPRYASEEYKDPRAPQNLYPIGGLERELRRRLGDQHIVYRALRLAANSQGGGRLPPNADRRSARH